MSYPEKLHWNSSQHQDHLSRIFNLPSQGVIDLTGYIDCGDFIAGGGSGHVFRGKWRKPNDSGSLSLEQYSLPNVVVKLINIPPFMDARKKGKRFIRMKREIEIWRQLNHRNILPLIGIARIDGDSNRPVLVSPWMEYGNVADFLKENPAFPVVSFLHDIIEGLHFLHTFEPEIVHGDIKAVNALVNYRREAYLCDFGLSRFEVDTSLWRTTAAQAGGTLRWMAPELTVGEVNRPTKASDIYAYGMTCYEILSGNVPFYAAKTEWSVVDKLRAGERPERITSCHPEIWSIITQCWAQNVEERPSSENARKLVMDYTEGSRKLKEEIITNGRSVERMFPYLETAPSTESNEEEEDISIGGSVERTVLYLEKASMPSTEGSRKLKEEEDIGESVEPMVPYLEKASIPSMEDSRKSKEEEEIVNIGESIERMVYLKKAPSTERSQKSNEEQEIINIGESVVVPYLEKAPIPSTEGSRKLKEEEEIINTGGVERAALLAGGYGREILLQILRKPTYYWVLFPLLPLLISPHFFLKLYSQTTAPPLLTTITVSLTTITAPPLSVSTTTMLLPPPSVSTTTTSPPTLSVSTTTTPLPPPSVSTSTTSPPLGTPPPPSIAWHDNYATTC